MEQLMIIISHLTNHVSQHCVHYEADVTYASLKNQLAHQNLALN